MTKFAEDLAEVEQRPVEPVVSLFNGVFFCLFMSSQIIGNTISMTILKVRNLRIKGNPEK